MSAESRRRKGEATPLACHMASEREGVLKTLSLLRHAKARRDLADVEDFERPLAPRGMEAAPLMGRYLRETGARPDLVICSPALRTVQTAHLALAALGEPQPPVRFEPRIYEAETATLLEVVRQADPAARHVLMIGHNPGFQELVLLLVGDNPADAGSPLIANFPTAALAMLALDVERWADAAAERGRVIDFVTPRALGQRREGK